MADEYLVVTSGVAEGQHFDLGGDSAVIGRDPSNEVTVEDTQISRHHAKLVRRDGGLQLEDLGSTNGTFLNDARLTAPAPVRPGDRIRVGRVVLELRAPVARTEIGSPDGYAPPAPPPQAPPPQAPPPQAPPPQAPPPPPPPPPPAGGGFAAPPGPHGYPEPPAQRAARWERVPGERDPQSGLKGLRSDAQVRRRAYLLTFAVLVLVALAVALYLVSR